MKSEIRATYVTEWDDGETIIESPCKVNLLTHEIISFGKRHIIDSPYTNATLDDNVETLNREYLRFTDGTEIDVIDSSISISADEYDGIMPFFRR